MRETTTHVELGDDLHRPVEEGRPLRRHPLVLAVAALVLFGVGFGAFLLVHNRTGGQRTDSEASGTTVAPATTEAAGTPSSAPTATTRALSPTSLPVASTAGTPAAGASGAGLPPMADNAAYVEATLNLDAGPGPGLFRLSGRVPDAETAKALQQAAELSYAPYVESSLKVDPTLPAAPWLAQGARLIGLLPSVTDGTIRVADGKVLVLARSPNPQYLQLFQGALQALGGGMPVTMVKTTITDQVPPHFFAEVAGGKVKLSGDVPSPAIKALLEGGAASAYGKDSVASTITVDPAGYTSFWMYTMPGIFQLFRPFPTYKVQVVNGQASGTLQGGVGFAVDSTEITPEMAKVLDVGVSIMARDPSIYMTVIGYTDATGSADHNQALSEARARSVAQYFVKAGIPHDRLTSMGKGEADPIATNDDPAGRALNRRVAFTFGAKSG